MLRLLLSMFSWATPTPRPPVEGTALERVLRRRYPPAPPPGVVVDWDQSPRGYPIWKHDAEKGVSVWMNGQSRVEEYGQVWDALPAPSFGATVTCRAVLSAQEQGALEARRRARRLERDLGTVALPSPPRPRL